MFNMKRRLAELKAKRILSASITEIEKNIGDVEEDIDYALSLEDSDHGRAMEMSKTIEHELKMTILQNIVTEENK